MKNPIDLKSPAFVADPYPTYRRMREKGAPYWCSRAGGIGGEWMLTSYEDVAAVLKESRISKDVSRLVPVERLTPLNRTMIGKDPPDHARLRGPLNETFTPARVKRLEARIERLVDALIDSIQPAGQMDFVTDFALPFPVMVICEMLGVPYEDRDQFQAWSQRIIRGGDLALATGEDLQDLYQGMAALEDYFTRLIRKRREQPREDLISALIAAYDRDDHLTESELRGTCMLLLIAGFETTVNLLSNGLFTLLRHPDQCARLKSRPELMPSAVEEILRYESSLQCGTFRFVREPVTVGGVKFAPGEQVCAVIGAANRDPAQFPDPDRFDISRTPNRHLAFGLGIHFCIGAVLARTEARIGFTRLLERLPSLQLAMETPQWKPSTLFRGLSTLPVTF